MRYFAPDAILPIGSAIAGAVGVLLMFGRRIAGVLRTAAARVFGRGRKADTQPAKPEQAPGQHRP